jgi:Nucleotidyl transferase AbiEii toxin, Type IV TA system
MARRFGSAAAFKASLEANLKKIALERKSPFSTLQLKFVIERLLARLFRDPEPPWLLKGGFAMDLRFRPKARTTKDVDLSVSHASTELASDLSGALRDRIQEAVDGDLGDYLTYRIGAPRQELTNAPLGGARYPCEAVLVGKTYAKFHIDVGCGDALVGEPERLAGDDLLSFAGIPPAAVMAISKPQQFAEKLHAYTFPWAGRLNTRTKDLVDLVLLIERGSPDIARIRSALRATFAARGTHTLPTSLVPPPAAWAIDFPAMAIEAGLSTSDCFGAFSILEAFWTSGALGPEPVG